MPAVIESLLPLLDSVCAEARDAGLSTEEVQHLRLGCEEIIANVINYAYPDAPGEIEVLVNRGGPGQRITVVVQDWGKAFDPLSMPEPDIGAPVEHRPIGGLGVYLTRRLLDQVAYARVNGANVLTLKKL